MNLRRGLFRLWIVGSALWALAVAFVSYSEIKKQFNDIAVQAVLLDERKVEFIVPQLCGNARGVAGTDYATQFRKEGPGPWDTYAKPNPFDNCWYEMSKFRPLYPEYKDVSDKELSRKLYAEHGVPIRELPNPWETLGVWAAIAFGIPLVVLALGSSLLWALSGFAVTRN
jgi:hypothetical protein